MRASPAQSAARAILSAALAASAACYNPTIANSQLVCDPAGDVCPDNFHCASDGTCWRNGEDPPLSVPGSPLLVHSTPLLRGAQVSWFPPTDDGGKPITKYFVTAAPGGAQAVVDAPHLITSATVTGLDDATSYTFTVTAQNDLGVSPPSLPSAAITTPGLPGPPTGVVATAGSGAAVVTWTPATDSGAPIQWYRVVATPAGAAATVGTTVATMYLLQNGTSYTFTVYGHNEVGDGPVSEPSAPVTPGGP